MVPQFFAPNIYSRLPRRKNWNPLSDARLVDISLLLVSESTKKALKNMTKIAMPSITEKAKHCSQLLFFQEKWQKVQQAETCIHPYFDLEQANLSTIQILYHIPNVFAEVVRRANNHDLVSLDVTEVTIPLHHTLSKSGPGFTLRPQRNADSASIVPDPCRDRLTRLKVVAY